MNPAPLRQSKNTIMVCTAFFTAFILFSIFRASFHSIDTAVNLWTISLHNNTAILLAKVISICFDTNVLVIATLLIAGFLYIKKHKAKSILLIIALSGNLLLVSIIKTLTHVARPENQLLESSRFSYPSGHSTGVIILIGLITYYIWLNWNNNQRIKITAITSFSLITAIVGFDRFYLNVHWISDVIGGCLFGAFWLSFCIIIYQYLKNNKILTSDT